MLNDEKENSLKGINSVHPANRLIYLKLIEIRELYRNKSPQICLSLTKAIGSLKRYPLPITDMKEVSLLSGLGVKFCKHVQRVLKDKAPAVELEESRKHGLINLHRVYQFLKKNNYFSSVKTKSYRPPTYSNSWTFLCILGFCSDSGGLKNRLTLDDVRMMFAEFSKVFPKAKLTGYEFLKILTARQLLNFRMQGHQEILSDNFQYKFKRRYSYGLTSEGRELAETLISKLDIPLNTIKSTFNKIFLLTNQLNPDNIASQNSDFVDIESFRYSEEEHVNGVPPVVKEKQADPVTANGELTFDNEVHFKSLRERLKIKYGIDVFAESDYEIITVVDKRELHDSNGRYFNKLTSFYKDSKKSIVFKHLPLGDVVWVIKLNNPVYTTDLNNATRNDPITTTNEVHNGEAGKKEKKPRKRKMTAEDRETEHWFVLDWILERKTTLDLNSSIMDGRYEEQKMRLLNLRGFNRVVYLFEDSPLEQVTNKFAKLGQRALNYKAIQTAKINTKFVSGFNVINTTGISHSASMLLYLHITIENYFKDKFRSLRVMGDFDLNDFVATSYYPFARFKDENRKRFRMTYCELFGRQLRCIPRMGEQLTCSILTVWPTPYLFYEAINNMTLDEINQVLSQVPKKCKMPRQVYDLCRDLFMSSANASAHSEACSDTPYALQPA